jgi:molybdenum-dependent DNA-binding transcriptional regulator ModE
MHNRHTLRNRLKLRQMHLLATLADAPSLHKAAARLGMSQPAATRLLQELEETMGGPLFERTGRGLAPTDMGRLLMRHAQLLVAGIDQVYEEALALRTGDAVMHVRRTLSFAAIPTILEDIWLPGNAFKGLTAEQMSSYQGPTYAMFELVYGVRMVRADEKIRAVLPDAEQAQLLNIPSTTPLLSVERTAYTYNDVPMELRRGLYRTDTHHYRNALN